jgi:hypothetical protein
MTARSSLIGWQSRSGRYLGSRQAERASPLTDRDKALDPHGQLRAGLHRAQISAVPLYTMSENVGPHQDRPASWRSGGSMTAEQRCLRAQIAANTRWSRPMAREDQAEAARSAFYTRLERSVSTA